MNELIQTLEAAKTHSALSMTIKQMTLSAAEWKQLAMDVTARRARSGQNAREMIETHYSNNLLLAERIEQVKRSCNS